uniref:Uncharacterized protein n=1 Tax=Steinernema glaseri TaxID=37863 RepID=A0A1I7ZYC3_9BILA
MPHRRMFPKHPLLHDREFENPPKSSVPTSRGGRPIKHETLRASEMQMFSSPRDLHKATTRRRIMDAAIIPREETRPAPEVKKTPFCDVGLDISETRLMASQGLKWAMWWTRVLTKTKRLFASGSLDGDLCCESDVLDYRELGEERSWDMKVEDLARQAYWNKHIRTNKKKKAYDRRDIERRLPGIPFKWILRKRKY